MRKRIRTVCFLCIAMMFAVIMAGCGRSANTVRASENEIMLIIQLDLKEDIGLLILDSSLDGTETSGGVSNADRSMLKHDEILYWSIDREVYDDPADTADLSVRFRVITEYCDPNYENDYPEEYEILLDPVSFTAAFGKDYRITITGDKNSGYRAVLDAH